METGLSLYCGIGLHSNNHLVTECWKGSCPNKLETSLLVRINRKPYERIESDTIVIVMLAYLHDIAKTQGTAKPMASVELLPKYAVFDSVMTDYVKYHDINLPGYIAYSKGQAPGDKAWRKLVNKISIKLLCLFMIADRVDCPGGWQTNEAMMWFLSEVMRRELLNEELVY